ncbi:MAG: SCO6880 family protein [Egibacteraceae bacterium]
MSTDERGRLYRFAARDRAGWFLGLGGQQCLALGVAVFASVVLLNAGTPAPIVLAPVFVGLAYVFVRVGTMPLHEWLPVTAAWTLRRLTGRTSWHARVPLLTGSALDSRGQPDLPPCLSGLVLLHVPTHGSARSQMAGIGVVKNTAIGAFSATLRVRGREFALLDASEQERMVAGWGDALVAFCVERGPVAFVRWSEWSAPAGLDEQLRYLEEHGSAPDDSPAVMAYRDLLDDAGTMATRHEVLVTLTVETRRVRVPRQARTDPDRAVIEVLVEELRLLTARLESASLIVDPPLSPVELATAIRLRSDPACRVGIATRQRGLAAQAGVVSPCNAGPMATVAHRTHFEVDGALHRSYLISEWPRLDVPPNWMESLLLHAGDVRTVSVTYHPVAPSRSTRQINRDSTRLASDAELRDRKGFRVSAHHRRAQEAVEEREAELVSGFGEMEYFGIVTVTARDEEALARSSAEYEQVAAQAGLELRPLDGQHDLAFAAILPLGATVPTRRLA